MDQFGNILTNATNNANQTYQTDTANAANAQNQANTANANVNSEAQTANQNAAKLSALGDQYSNMGNVTNMYNQDQQTQLNNMGFDKNTLNQANQNIAQETGQLGAANNQMAATGGTRGFDAVGTANRQADIQNQASNAIGANTKVQSNELGQSNAASGYTGQEINAQQTSQGNAIQAYNDAATQNNNVMANYANTLNTLANQATTYGGLVGSNVANLMAGANSAAQANLAKYQAGLAVAQTNQAQAQAGLYSAQTALTQSQTTGQNIQNTYNHHLNTWKESAQKQVQKNNDAITSQVNILTANINNDKSLLSSYQKGEQNSTALFGWSGLLYPVFGGIANQGLSDKIASEQSQIQSLNKSKSANVM